MSGSNILFALTGSIAAYKACEAISRLVQRGHRLRIVATPAALRFVGRATLEGLAGGAVSVDLFEPGRALDHIGLARWADAVIVCPATAHTLNRLAAGLADDLLGALFLAHDPAKPWLFAPAMNPAMLLHPATVAARERLQRWGARWVAAGSGRTACGEEGEGRLAEPDEIVAAVESALAQPARRLRILVTSGGTSEPIDGVRVLTNTSTGRTGALLAGHFAGRGHAVTLLRSGRSVATEAPVVQETFGTFAELDDSLGRLLGGTEFDAVIHAAAVGDFAVAEVSVAGRPQPPGTKLDSRLPVTLMLRPQPKLVQGLRAQSRNHALAVVAFKLTAGASPEEAQRAVDTLFAEAAPDYIVHNDLAARGAEADAFPSVLHVRGGASAFPCPTRRALAVELENRLASLPASA